MPKNNVLSIILYVCIFFALSSCNQNKENSLSEVEIQKLNQAAGLMGQYQYQAAVEIYSPIHQKYPTQASVTLDLSVAVLNRQQDGDIEYAIELASSVLQQQPNNIRANYLVGILYLYLGQAKQALAPLQIVVQTDSKDAYAEYFYAQALEQQGDFEQAYNHYAKAAVLLPYLRSASYAAAMTARKLGKKQLAKTHLNDYKKLKNNPRALLAEYKYTRMGPLAEITITKDKSNAEIGFNIEPAKWKNHTLLNLEQTPIKHFAVIQEIAIGLQSDLLFSNKISNDTVQNIKKSGFNLRYLPVDSVSQSSLADINNDGLTDALICKNGNWQLFIQDVSKSWTAIDIFSNSKQQGQNICGASQLFDADHDGDIDIFIADYQGADELFSNNGNMTFRKLSENWKQSNTDKTVQIIPVDWDHDRDLDILLLKQSGKLELLNNQLLWSYVRQPIELTTLKAIKKALVFDYDADGSLELLTLDNDKVLMWLQDEKSGWHSKVVIDEVSGYENLLLEDFDGDGILELVVFGERGIRWQSLLKQSKAQQLSTQNIQQLNVIANPSTNGPMLLSLESTKDSSEDSSEDGKVVRSYFESANTSKFIQLQLQGGDNVQKSLRSNFQAIGSEVRGRVGKHWIIKPTFTANSQSGQNVIPKMLATIGTGALDFIEIRWPDGVFQTELNIANGPQKITEKQRQLSSCPVLFVETENGYQFVSDILGVGGVGFFAEPGVYVEPRPWEYFMLPKNLITSGSNNIRLKITEPMEENTYLDNIHLHRYRLPEEWKMVMDERMGVNQPLPSGDPLFYRNSFQPVKVEDGKGNDISEYLNAVDNKPAPIGKLHQQYLGLVEKSQQLVLYFPQIQQLGLDNKQLGLIVDGWVEYPYSQTVFAAWQSGESYQSPTIDVLVNHQWQTLHDQIGYPAGMPRQSYFPLQGLPKGTTAIRLTTNLELYFDAIRLVEIESPPEYQKQTAKMSKAKMEYLGFPERTNAASNRPVYQYQNRSPYSDMKTLTGDFTRYGEISALLNKQDNAFAIIGSGDAVAVEFQFEKDPKKSQQFGSSNDYYVLEARGYAKDMDLYTGDGGTVKPLPLTPLSQKMIPETAQQAKTNSEKLHDRYNTRYQDGW